ncbi:MAG: hypothetical protein N4A53_01250 [Pelagimonas sp.]|jgi:hypothetical protein|nr:hypothetical protein [Pelagimonas sp.]
MGLEFLLVFMGLVPFAASAAGVSEGEDAPEGDGFEEEATSLDWSELEAQLPDTEAEDIPDAEAYAGAGSFAGEGSFAAQIADFDPAEDMLLIEYPGADPLDIAGQKVTETGLQITLSDGGEIALDGVEAPLPDDAFGFVSANG